VTYVSETGVTGLAIAVVRAFETDAACVAVDAATVDIGFGTVGAMVRTLIADADEFEGVTGQAAAIVVDQTALAQRAAGAVAASAIGVSFVAVLPVILALRGDAGE